METYKKTLSRRKVVSAIGMLLAIAALAFSLVYQMPGRAPDDGTFSQGFMAGFQAGIICVVIVMLGVDIVKSWRALRDEKRLRAMYIEETDERQQWIDQKAGSIGMNIVSYGMSLATALAGSFNETVFFTLLGATVFIVGVRVFLMNYYRNKY